MSRQPDRRSTLYVSRRGLMSSNRRHNIGHSSHRPLPAFGLACTVLLSSCSTTAVSSTVTTVEPVSSTVQSTAAPTTPTPTTEAPPDDAMVPWIAYQSPAGLQLVSPDGSRSTSRTALPDGPDGALHPDWSADGQRLAFAVDDADGTRDIWTANWDGTDPTLLVDCQSPCRDADNPAWSPDGMRIAFNRNDLIDGRNPGSKIQTVDVRTGEVETVATTEGAEYGGSQRWSPNGLSLVVEITRYIDDGNDTEEITGRTIAVIDLTAAAPTLRLLRPFDTFSSYPDWHPTDDLILFASGSMDPLDPSLPPHNLFTIKPDGTDLTQITSQGPNDDGLWMAAFRLDGEGILATLVHRPNGNLTLVSLHSDGSGITELGDTDAIPGAHPRQRPTG